MSDVGAFSRRGSRFALQLGPEERDLVARLLVELRSLLTSRDEHSAAALVRLFPVVHPDDPEREAEYQRLMRDELVTSRLSAIGVVESALAESARSGGHASFDEGGLLAFMQAVNGVRLVLGTLLEVSEDDSPGDLGGALAPEYHLYAFLSWVLDSAVAALTPDTWP